VGHGILLLEAEARLREIEHAEARVRAQVVQPPLEQGREHARLVDQTPN
jgi:hypothetical protein